MVLPALMNIVQLIKHLNKKAPRNSYYIYGEDHPQAYFCEQKVVQRFMLNTTTKTVLDGKHDKWSQVYDAITIDSILSDTRVVCIRNFEKFKTNKSEFYDFLQQDDKSCVIIVTAAYDRHKQDFPKLASTVGEVSCKYLSEISGILLRWMDQELAARNLTITDNLKEQILRVYGNSVIHVMNILNQMQFYDVHNLGEQVFLQLLSAAKKHTTFDLVKSICHRDPKETFQIYNAMREQGDLSVNGLLTVLQSQFLLLYKLISLQRQNAQDDAISADLDINRFFLPELKSQAQQFDRERLRQALEMVVHRSHGPLPSIYDIQFLLYDLCA